MILTLTNKEQVLGDYVYNIIVPEIHNILKKANTKQYYVYNCRICMQISIILNMFLTKAMPEYSWTSVASTFDNKNRKYTHAWDYGFNLNKEYLILDYGKLKTEYHFFIKTTKIFYPDRLDDYYFKIDTEHPEQRRKIYLNIEREFFTDKPIKEILEQLEKKLRINYEELKRGVI